MSDLPLRLHSLTEGRLYLMVTPCGQCAAGPLEPQMDRIRHDTERNLLAVPVCCKACSGLAEVVFEISGIDMVVSLQTVWGGQPDGSPAVEAAINPTREPSRVIDVAGWLTLHSMLERAAREAAEESASPAERAGARIFQRQAAECLDEALKFYRQGEELPPRKAFFLPKSRRQFRDRPEVFIRQRIVALRAQTRSQPIRGSRP